MSNIESPDNRFHQGPFLILEDLDDLNEENLYKSADSDKGLLRKILDSLRYLHTRSPQCFSVRTDGAGAVSLQRRTPTVNGSTQFLTAGFNGTSAVRFTLTTAAASVDDMLVFVSINGTVDWFPRHNKLNTSTIDVSFYDVSVPGAVDPTANIIDFDLIIFPNLAGMT